MSHAATDAHAESSTYNVGVHKDTWHRRLRSLVVQAIALARLEGSGHALPRESRRAEDALMAHVPGDLDPRLAMRAMDTLRRNGYRWSDALDRWTPPPPVCPPPPCAIQAPQAPAAAAKLASMGWVGTGAEWENRKPAPSVLDTPLGETVRTGRHSFGAGVKVRRVVEALTEARAEIEERDAARGLSAPLGIEIILAPIGSTARRFAASDPLRLLVDHANMLTGQLQAVHEALQTPGVTGL